MRVFAKKSLRVWVLAIVGMATVLAAAAPVPQQQATPADTPESALSLDPAQTKVHWILDTTLHTVHGTFALKSGAVYFNPQTGKAGGEIIVFAPSGESGSNLRDKRMHKEILDTAKYPDVIFRPTQLEGRVAQAGGSDIKLNGVFSIHGADHDVSAQVHTEFSGNHWHGTAKFQVPYVQWGIKDPSNFLLKVKPVVDVELEMSGEVASPR
jgi:polyisoprenoid-binding protein YceI